MGNLSPNCPIPPNICALLFLISALLLLPGTLSHYTPGIIHRPVTFFDLPWYSLMTQPAPPPLYLSHPLDLHCLMHSLISILTASFTFHQYSALISFQYLYLTLYSLTPFLSFLTFLLCIHKASTPCSPTPSYPVHSHIYPVSLCNLLLWLRTCPSDDAPNPS